MKGAFGFAVTEAPLRQETATAYNAARLPHPAACHLFHARSTVATMTEIHDFLRVLYTRVGTAHCPECGTVLEAQPRDQIVERILTARLGEPLEPPPVSPARGPPADWGELVQAHPRSGNHSGTDRRAAHDRHPQPLSGAGREATKRRERPTGRRSRLGTVCAQARKTPQQRGSGSLRQRARAARNARSRSL